MNANLEFARVSNTFFHNGEYIPVSQGRDVVDPSNNRVIGQMAEVGHDDIEAVVATANAAQKAWYAYTALDRAEMLHKVAAEMKKLAPEIAELLTRETGKPYKESSDEMAWSGSAVDYYAELGRHSIGSVLGTSVVGQTHYTLKEPMGTVVSILPANFPILLLMWSAAAALAAGNSVIVKPSENASLTTLSFMRVFRNLPTGLVQCVSGGADTAKQLVSHKNTHMIAFTGSVATGQAVSRACAEHFKPHLIEASGSDAFLVMPSAPIDVAARAATFASFFNAGQVCTSAEKILVHEDVYDQFMETFVANVKRLRIGHGLDKVDFGPMENAREVARVEQLVARAVEQGAAVTIGGHRLNLGGELQDGFFYAPTVLEGLRPDMDIFTTEVFGPVAPVYKVSSFEEALKIANDSPFGLGATLYSKDIEEITRATNEIVSGMVWVNAPILDNDAGPFGGRKMSGIGRQLGAEGLDTFRHTKLVMIDPAASSHDFWWFPYKDKEAWRGAQGSEEAAVQNSHSYVAAGA
ncbi:aldehyde dehydrogenase [Arthrobacter sp. StoSoilA2]|uniref:aldehyde dehydrogenase family protein n=1 Tax=unclassified Arthrobacter TaxID=235627 RepID=UPI001CC360C0|nr:MULTISPECIES: aldehyde dehydrogenase family protein [unclassified Arthrobacter]BCW38380.1 aldehyde dehydrogenase [Arthrobacter sp. StoSoilA2]BCW50352.1 aldehyde dehydrogenase [Arthrobacter sp. StoSoilB13]